ncbi:MAG: hypothetical protein L0Y70_21190, partial [Gemmataceae bacterium]|nr:hypothetical protein [Gemmataceae bacterium]
MPPLDFPFRALASRTPQGVGRVAPCRLLTWLRSPIANRGGISLGSFAYSMHVRAAGSRAVAHGLEQLLPRCGYDL